MRFKVIEAVYDQAIKDKNLFFITGDYGHAKTKEFRENCAGRYFNAGMSEQNIIGMAAGLALTGKQAVVYSIVPFITLRCYEQIKVDVCDHKANVLVVGGGGGFSYSSAGATHLSIEEIGALRCLPYMKIVAPADPEETYSLTKQLLEAGGPAYIRVGRGKEESLPQHEVVLGKAAIMHPGTDITIIAYGVIMHEALKVAKNLESEGISVEVLNMHTIKPLDTEAILERAGKRRAIFTLEEHNIIGGLGGAVSETLMESKVRPPIFHRFGVNDMWPEEVGDEAYMRDISGISASKVSIKIKELLK